MHILITAGPTIEYFDSVRFISNASSGKMGYAIAAAAVRAGHRVTLVSGPVALGSIPGVRVVRVTSAREMLTRSRAAFKNADAAIFAAAVCDYRPRHRSSTKIPKNSKGCNLELVANPDIAATLSLRKGHRITIGFALEDRDMRQRAERKLQKKRLDAIILNSPENIASEQASVQVLAQGHRWEHWPRGSKTRTGRQIVKLLERLVGNSR